MLRLYLFLYIFFFNDTATTEIYTLSLHDALPISGTAAYLEMNLKHWADHGFGMWMLRDAISSAVIGRAILRHLDVEGVDEVEVGYGIMPECWGRGLATEIAQACVRVGFEQLGLSSLVAITTPPNLASQRVMTKAALAYERDIVHAGTPHLLFRIR